MKNFIVFIVFTMFVSTVSAKSENQSRVMESALVKLISEPTQYYEGKVKVFDLARYSDLSCITCWETIALSKRYWVQIAGQKTKGKLSDLRDLKETLAAVFISNSNQITRISFPDAHFTQEYHDQSSSSGSDGNIFP